MALTVEEKKRRRALSYKKWAESHKEYNKARQHQWYLENKEKINAQSKLWHREHREEINARRKERYHNDPVYRENLLSTIKEWRHKHPEKMAEYYRRKKVKRVLKKDEI